MVLIRPLIGDFFSTALKTLENLGLLLLTSKSRSILFLAGVLANFPEESLTGFLVGGASVEDDFAFLLESLEELGSLFITFFFEKVEKHDLEILTLAVLGEVNIDSIHEFPAESHVKGIANIDLIVVSGDAWKANREHLVCYQSV